MFWIVAGAILAIVLTLAGISDLRRKRRTGTIASIDHRQVKAGVRAARARARSARRFTRF